MVHKELGAFIALIVVNCLILGRQEAFASRNSPSGGGLADALGMSLGFSFALLLLGAIREILGSGSLFGRLALRPELRALGDHDPAAGGLPHARPAARLFATPRSAGSGRSQLAEATERRAA